MIRTGRSAPVPETALPRRRRFSPRAWTGKLHRWLGLLSGLIVFIVSVTGCIYVFEKEIKSLVYRDRLYVEPSPAPPLPVSRLWEKAQAALGDSLPLGSAEVFRAPDRSWAFSSYKSDSDALTYFGEQVRYYRVFMNPYDGSVLKIENTKYEFFTLVVWLHWSLLLSNKIGQPIVGTAVLIFVVLLLSGLVLWWPRHKAALKARLRIDWRAGLRRQWKRLNWDLHSVPGFYALVFALIVALTGLVWAFDWFEDAVHFVASGGEAHAEEPPVLSDTTLALSQPGSVLPPASLMDLAWRTVHARHLDFNTLYLSPPDERDGTFSAFARFGEHAHYNYAWLLFDQYSGQVLKEETFADLDRADKLRSLNYDLHVGSILGLPGKILAFIVSFICATLPVSGFLIWWGKSKRKAAPRA